MTIRVPGQKTTQRKAGEWRGRPGLPLAAPGITLPSRSEDYRTRLEQHDITCSMSRRGNCYDNAVMESWFSTVKSEEGERF
jgi:putative transposase